MNEPISLAKAFENISSYSYKCWLFLSEVEKWTLDSPCLVIECVEVPPDQEDEPKAGYPDLALRHNMMITLEIATVQDILQNAKSQKPDAQGDDLFKAFIYYYDYDAFIEF